MMKSNSIAVLADSCNDIPQELLDKYHIYILPLMINYKDASYRDRVDITPEQVYERFQEEIPKTSLPLPETMMPASTSPSMPVFLAWASVFATPKSPSAKPT